MGAGGDDRLLPHPVAVEGLDVAAGEHLVDVVVAHPAGRVAGAGLLLAQDGEVDQDGHREGDGHRVEAIRNTFSPLQPLVEWATVLDYLAFCGEVLPDCG